MRLSGNALYYSIIILLISSSTIGIILLRNYYSNKSVTDAIIRNQVRENILSGFELIRAGEFDGEDSVSVDLFGDGLNIVRLDFHWWGSFRIAKAEASIKDFSVSRTALLGANHAYEEPVALYLPDQGRILSVSGSSIIRGISYLPQKTLRPAAIEGVPFIYRKVAEGEIKASEITLPPLNNDLFIFADDYLINGFGENDSIVNFSSLESFEVQNSFENKTLIILCNETEDLSYYSFSGNIVIWSAFPLTLTSSTSVTDAIVFALSITIQGGFEGSLQAYALQSIMVEKNCGLRYPTLLNVIQSEGKYNPADSLKIILDDHSSVDGGIFIRSSGLQASLKISNHATVCGMVYVPGPVEMSGEITGSLWCKSFYLQTERSRYENHLLNCSIDRISLPVYFSSIDIHGENKYKTIIRWLQ